MWNLRRIMELQALAQSTTWSDVLSLYFWRAKEADLRLARMINNVSAKSIEYLQELVQRDEEMVQRLQALEREVEERADEKMLFIEKLKGNDLQHDLLHIVSPGRGVYNPMMVLERSLVGIVHFLHVLLDADIDLCPFGGFHVRPQIKLGFHVRPHEVLNEMEKLDLE
ncbi:hypothetical protein Tco_0606190 [Tanacetum coccineum]